MYDLTARIEFLLSRGIYIHGTEHPVYNLTQIICDDKIGRMATETEAAGQFDSDWNRILVAVYAKYEEHDVEKAVNILLKVESGLLLALSLAYKDWPLIKKLGLDQIKFTDRNGEREKALMYLSRVRYKRQKPEVTEIIRGDSLLYQAYIEALEYSGYLTSKELAYGIAYHSPHYYGRKMAVFLNF